MYTFWFPQDLDQNLNITAPSCIPPRGTFPRALPPHNSFFFHVPLAAHQSVYLPLKKADLPCVYSVCGFQFCSSQCFPPGLQVPNLRLPKVSHCLPNKHKFSPRIQQR